MQSYSPLNYEFAEKKQEGITFDEFSINNLLQYKNNVVTLLAFFPKETGLSLLAYDINKKEIINKIPNVNSAQLISANEIFVKYVENPYYHPFADSTNHLVIHTNQHQFAIYHANDLSVHTEKFSLPVRNKNLELLSTYWNGDELYFDYPWTQSWQPETVIYNVKTKTIRTRGYQYHNQLQILDNHVVHYCSEWAGKCWPTLERLDTGERINFFPIKEEGSNCNGWSTEIHDVFIVNSIMSYNKKNPFQCLQFFLKDTGSYIGRVYLSTLVSHFALLADQRTLLAYNSKPPNTDKNLYFIDLHTKAIRKFPMGYCLLLPMQDGSFLVANSNTIARYYLKNFYEPSCETFLSSFAETNLIDTLIKLIHEYTYDDVTYTKYTPNHLAFFPKNVEEVLEKVVVEETPYHCRIL